MAKQKLFFFTGDISFFYKFFLFTLKLFKIKYKIACLKFDYYNNYKSIDKNVEIIFVDDFFNKNIIYLLDEEVESYKSKLFPLFENTKLASFLYANDYFLTVHFFSFFKYKLIKKELIKKFAVKYKIIFLSSNTGSLFFENYDYLIKNRIGYFFYIIYIIKKIILVFSSFILHFWKKKIKIKEAKLFVSDSVNLTKNKSIIFALERHLSIKNLSYTTLKKSFRNIDQSISFKSFIELLSVLKLTKRILNETTDLRLLNEFIKYYYWDFLLQKNITHEVLNKIKPTYILTFSNSSSLDRCLHYYSRLNGVKIVEAPHSVSNTRFYLDRYAKDSDIYIYWNDGSYKVFDLLNRYNKSVLIPSERNEKTFYNLTPDVNRLNVKKIRKIGVSVDQTFRNYGFVGLSSMVESHLEVLYNTLFNTINDNIFLIFKTRPGSLLDLPACLYFFLKKYNIQNYTITDSPTDVWIESCDVIISDFSTIIKESFLAGKITIAVNFTGLGDFMNFSKVNGVFYCDNKSKLENLLTHFN